MEINVNLPGGAIVPGDKPIVIIGPNGVGKTRLGVALVQNNNSAERVAALRNVEIPEIPMQRFEQAKNDVQNALNQVLSSHWRQSFELQSLLAEILAEDREAAVKYREMREQNPVVEPDKNLSKTRLRRIVDIWNRHFPGRQIKISYQPQVERELNAKKVEYSIAQMSEGERTALYLTARVISCSKPIMLVDEPETFFHPLLARSLWDSLESEAPNIRFVYITHDIPFALSRKGAQFAIAKSETLAELLPATSSIPADVVSQVLGAASFSISASRLIFCEGEAESFDIPILQAWHNCPKTAVVPVGSCNVVRECVAVFDAGRITAGVTAVGYIDRDGWPDSYLGSDPKIKALPVSEIEGVLCVEAIFKALAKYNGLDDADAAQRYGAFLSEARKSFSGVVLNKEILNRAKKRVEIEQRALLNPIKPTSDVRLLKATFESVMPSGGWQSYLGTVFADEEARLTGSISGPPVDFLRDFPAKSFYAIAARHLNVMPDALVRTLSLALQLSDAKADTDLRLKALRDEVVRELAPRMWPRTT